LPGLLPRLGGQELERQISLAVLDNPLSPTVNLNGLFQLSAAGDRPVVLARELQQGLLVLINRHIARHHGVHPLGESFNVRSAPRSHADLLALAAERIPPSLMPQLVGVGDTITSSPGPTPGSWRRGGSDRGFLTLLQDLGRCFDRPNRVVLVDSSGGEVSRPSMADGSLRGLTDPEDPLRLNALFPGGPAQYRAFFGELAGAVDGRPGRP
jgi:glucosylglycerol 3-phosphatase